MSCVIVGVALASCSAPSTFASGAKWPTPKHGLVVCEEPLAAHVGARLLEEGGNAADAAVGAALALAVTHPQAGNLGGGGFALWVPHDTRSPARCLDFRETAPQAVRAEDFLDGNGALDPVLARRSVLACGVPGSPAGLWKLQREYGRLDFAAVAAPALELARDGFEVGVDLARTLAEPGIRARLGADEGARELFYPRGEPLARGAKLVQPALARTLERLIERGPREGFYTGPVANELVDYHSVRDGRLVNADLEQYEPVWREPLRGWFRGYEVLCAPPPSSGGVVLLQVLGILDGFPLDAEREAALAARNAPGASSSTGSSSSSSSSSTASNSAGAITSASAAVDANASAGISERALHWWIEALRLAYIDRAEHLGDPDAWGVPVAALLSPEWIAARRAQIGEQPNPSPRPYELPRESEQTTHISVLDHDGNAVALTTTLNDTFGSGLLVPELGFFLNNEMDDFALQSGTPNLYGLVGGSANALRPGRRPLSSMTPTVLRDNGNTVALVIGSPGGPRIITSVVQVLLRTLVYGQSLADAVAAPRLHQQAIPALTECESDYPPSYVARLHDRGHEIAIVPRRWASVQAIAVEPGGAPVGASDPRTSGAAVAEQR